MKKVSQLQTISGCGPIQKEELLVYLPPKVSLGLIRMSLPSSVWFPLRFVGSVIWPSDLFYNNTEVMGIFFCKLRRPCVYFLLDRGICNHPSYDLFSLLDVNIHKLGLQKLVFFCNLLVQDILPIIYLVLL